MALNDFWINVRIGSRSVMANVSVDSPKLNAGSIEQSLAASDLWLTPAAVDGFRQGDFDFLSAAERKKLTEAVGRFLGIASTVPADQPATNQQVRAALPAFREILDVMRPDKFADLDAFVAGKRVEQHLSGKLPVWVRELRFQTGEDAAGQMALWIWIEADDAALKPDVLPENTQAVKRVVERAVSDLALSFWPYVRFRSASENDAHGAKGGKR